MPVILWTDALVFLLLATLVAYFFYARRRPHLRAPWERVTRSASGMSALVVLAGFVGVGLLDSMHYRPQLERQPNQAVVYSTEVLSLLDSMVAPLRERRERTYSAPLAVRAYARETVEVQLPGGGVRQLREFPRLKWGGAHLSDEGARDRDIAVRAGVGFGLALLAWLALAAGMVRLVGGERTFSHAWRTVWRGATPVPWRAILISIGVLFVLVGPTIALCTHYHVFGTDKVGRDVLYLAMKGVRTGLVIGTLTTLVMMPFAVLLGIMAGYFRGLVDDVIQYLYTTVNSIPAVLLIAAAVLLMQVYIDRHPELFQTSAARADLRLLFLCFILGLTSWTGLARLLRGESLKLRELEFIQAAQAFGVGDFRIIMRHILPNVLHIVLISLVMDFSGLVLAEAVLSYVGVGVDPSMISFGTMINAARLEMSREPAVWWALTAAFAFMFAMVLSANLFADAVRDAFDPRVRVGGWAAA